MLRKEVRPLFSEMLQKSLVLAEDEAKSMGHHYVGTEHLLLALTRIPQGIAKELLIDCGLSHDVVLAKVREILERVTLYHVGDK